MSKLFFTNQDFHFPPFGILPKIMLSTHQALPSCGLLLIPENIGLFMYGISFFFLVKYLENSKS